MSIDPVKKNIATVRSKAEKKLLYVSGFKWKVKTKQLDVDVSPPANITTFTFDL